MSQSEIFPQSKTVFNRNPMDGSTDELIATTLRVAMFKPPFVVGEGFSKVALGRDGHNVSVLHLGSTAEATVLEISHTQNVDRGHDPEPDLPTEGLDSFASFEAVHKVVQRVVEFIEDPGQAYKLMEQNPFPKPQEIN